MLKPLQSMHAPDDRFQYLSFHDQTAGLIRPLRADDIYKDVSEIELAPSVPGEVRYQFDVARNAYLYAWHVYDFFTLAEQHTYVVLEMALGLRAQAAGFAQDRTLEPNLRLAIKHGWLSKADLEILGTPTSSRMSFLQALPKRRNQLLHGKTYLAPDLTLLIVKKCAELINKLYPPLRTDVEALHA